MKALTLVPLFSVATVVFGQQPVSTSRPSSLDMLPSRMTAFENQLQAITLSKQQREELRLELEVFRKQAESLAAGDVAGILKLRNMPLGQMLLTDSLKQVVDPNASPTSLEAVPGLRKALKDHPVREVTDRDQARFAPHAAGVFLGMNPLYSCIGSAVYIDRDYFATAKHVIDEVKSRNLGSIRAASKTNTIVSNQVFPIDLGSIRTDALRDVAVFRVRPSPEGTLPSSTFSPSPIFQGTLKELQFLSIAGFPYGSIVYSETQNNRLVRFHRDWKIEAAAAKADIFAVGNSYKGNSGSGLFDQNTGTLVAIVRAHGQPIDDFQPDGLNTIIPPTMEHAFRSVSIKYAIALINN